MKLNRPRWIGLVFGIVLVLSILSSNVYSIELEPFADTKDFSKVITNDMSAFIKEDFNSKYGAITISKTFLWITTDKIAEYTLTKNTELCIIHCEAEGRITLYSDGILFDDIKFKTLDGKGTSISNIEYLIFSGTKDNYVDVPDKYTKTCKDYIIGNKTKNMCSTEVSTYKKVNQPIEIWNKYNNEVLKAGDYRWKITGVKSQTQSVDFIPIRNNKEFSEWATWSSGLTVGLVSYYKLNESANGAIDSLGNNAGSGGSSITTTGIINNSRTIADTSDAINIGSSSQLQYTNFTWSGWFYKSGNGWGEILCAYPLCFTQFADGKPAFQVTDGDGWKKGPNNMLTGQWVHFLAVHRDNGTVDLYQNNVNVLSTVVASFSAGTLYLGGSPSLTGLGGNLDEVGIWNRTLSASEISDLYNSGAGITYPNTVTSVLTVVNSHPSNGAIVTTSSITFGCNATTAGTINITSVVLNATNGITNWEQSITGLNTQSYNATFTNSTLSDGNYNWNCLGYGDFANGTSSSWILKQRAYTSPDVIFQQQTPSDINSLNAVVVGVNITYNINSSVGLGLNLSSINIFYKQNSTTRNCITFINGSCISEWGYDPFNYNITSNFTFLLQDNEIYPATYLLDDDTFDIEAHTTRTLGNSNSFISIQLFNVTNTTAYNFFEIMANGTSIKRMYYCNSSYNFASDTVPDPTTSPKCTSIGSIPANQPYNHSHSINSAHQVLPLTINITTGTIGTVKVTPTSYFLLRGNTPTNSVEYYTIPNVTRADSIKLTTNNGGTYTNQAFTIDTHLHQFSGNSSLWYYVCANDTNNNQNCSTIRQDLYELGNLPPSAPHIYNPLNQTYAGIININYTASESPNGYAISNYNLTLWNSAGTFNQTLRATSLLLGYAWDSSAIKSGSFYIEVQVNDSLNQISNSYSDEFSLDNTAPTITIEYPYPNLNFTTNNIEVRYIASDIHLDACKWTRDNGVTNNTITCGNNITSEVWADGTNIVTIWVNDTLGNTNNASIEFGVDTRNPNVEITSPSNTTYNLDITAINYMASDANLNKCWYSTDLGLTNGSVMCGANVSGLTSTEGSNTWRVWANDTYGRSNMSSVTFFKDTVAPQVQITTPTAGTYITYIPSLNYTVSGATSCWYSLNGGATNTTITCGNNVTLPNVEGTYTYLVGAEDDNSNINHSTSTITLTWTQWNSGTGGGLSYKQNLGTVNDIGALVGYGACVWSAFKFTANDTYTLSQAEIYVTEKAGTPTVYAGVYSNSGDNPSIQLGVNSSSINSFNVSGYNNFTFAGNNINLISGNTYWILFRGDQPACDGGNGIKIGATTGGNIMKILDNSLSGNYYQTIDTANIRLYGGSNAGNNTIVSNSPADNLITSNPTVTFSCTANVTSGATITNISLWTDASGTWALNKTNIVTGIYNTTTFTNTYSSGNYKWACEACNSDSPCGFSVNRTFSFDTISPVVNITYPYNLNITTLTSPTNVTLNFTASDLNLDSCWYTLDYEVMDNSSNKTGIDLGNATTAFNIFVQPSSYFAPIINITANITQSVNKLEFYLTNVNGLGGNYVAFKIGIFNQNPDLTLGTQVGGWSNITNITGSNQWINTSWLNNFPLLIKKNKYWIIFINTTSLNTNEGFSIGDTYIQSGLQGKLLYYLQNNFNSIPQTQTGASYDPPVMSLNVKLWGNLAPLNNTIVSCGINSSVNLTSGYHLITYFANDTAGWESNVSSTFFINYIQPTSIGYTPTVISGETTNFYFNISADSITQSNATLDYAGSSYPMLFTIANSTNVYFYRTITLPTVSSSTSKTFNITYYVNGVAYNTSTYTQNIVSQNNVLVSETNCASGEFKLAYNFTFYDEDNQTMLSMDTVDYNFKYGLTNSTQTLKFGTLTATTNLYLCYNSSISPTFNMGYSQINYQKIGWVARRWYGFTTAVLTATTNNVSLYDLNNVNAQTFQLIIKGADGHKYINKYVSLIRWYPSLDTYTSTDWGITDNSATTATYVRPTDTDYRVGVYEPNGTLIYLASPIRFVCILSPCTYSLTVNPTLITYQSESTLQFTPITFNKLTNIWTFSYSDSSMLVQTINLSIYEDTGSEFFPICTNTVTGFAGAVTCNTSNYAGWNTTMTAYATRESPNHLAITDSTKTTLDGGVANTFGLFLSILIFLPIVFVFAMVSPVGAIIGGVVGLIPAMILGSVPWGVFGAFAVICGIIMHFINKRVS